MKEIVPAILPLLTTGVNTIVIFLCLTSKRNILFGITMFLLLTLAIATTNVFVIKLYLPEFHKETRVLQILLFLPLFIALFREPLIKKIFSFCMIMTLSSVIRLSGIAIAEIFVARGENAYYWALLISSLTLHSIYIFLTVKFGRRLLRELFAYGRTKEWVLYTLSVAISWIFLELLQLSFTANIILSIYVVFFVLWSFIILCFAIINAHAKAKLKYEADFAESIISTGQKYHQSMEDMYKTLSILRHDYKYHLRAINNLFNSGKLEEAKQYLDDIQKEAPENKLRHYCSNAVFNALLSSYAERCEKLKIEFKIDLEVPEQLGVSNYEICIVLGNLLENAVEASEKLERDRKIELAIKTQGSYLAIMVENNFSGDSTLISAKKNGGFGLQSIRAVATRYEGHTMMEWNKGVFKIYVMLRV